MLIAFGAFFNQLLQSVEDCQSGELFFYNLTHITNKAP